MRCDLGVLEQPERQDDEHFLEPRGESVFDVFMRFGQELGLAARTAEHIVAAVVLRVWGALFLS